jgi:LPXTG-site transpeptidase (sortase) family protein
MFTLRDLAKRVNFKAPKSREEVLSLIYRIGIILAAIGFAIVFIVYAKVFIVYLNYYFNKPSTDIEVRLPSDAQSSDTDSKVLEFKDKDFGIIIPKIDTNAKVIKDTDAFDADAYKKALAEGVAHAKGTSYPGSLGNTFLFAHSAVAFYEATNQNVQFYLLSELTPGDKIYVAFENKIYKYSVEESIKVNPSEVQYLTQYRDYNTLTLMTCWPAGVNYKRLIIVAKEID